MQWGGRCGELADVMCVAHSRGLKSVSESFLPSLGLRFLICAVRIHSVLLMNWQSVSRVTSQKMHMRALCKGHRTSVVFQGGLLCKLIASNGELRHHYRIPPARRERRSMLARVAVSPGARRRHGTACAGRMGQQASF